MRTFCPQILPRTQNPPSPTVSTAPCKHSCKNNPKCKHPCRKRYMQAKCEESPKPETLGNKIPIRQVLYILKGLCNSTTGLVFRCLLIPCAFLKTCHYYTTATWTSVTYVGKQLHTSWILLQTFFNAINTIRTNVRGMSASALLMALSKLLFRVLRWYFCIQTNTQAPNRPQKETETGKNCRTHQSHLENRKAVNIEHSSRGVQPCTTTRIPQPKQPANHTCTASNAPSSIESCRTQSKIKLYEDASARHLDEVPDWIFDDKSKSHSESEVPPPTVLETHRTTPRRQFLHFVQRRAQPVKIRTLSDTSWQYFPDIRAASESQIVKARISSHQAAQTAIRKSLLGNGNPHDLVLQAATHEELMTHRACDYIEVTQRDQNQPPCCHTSWTSLLHDTNLHLSEKYSSAGSLGRAVMKVLNGEDIPHLRHLHITLKRCVETERKSEYEHSAYGG